MCKKEKKYLPNIIRRFILSWIFAAAAAYLSLPGDRKALSGLDGLQEMSLLLVVAVTVVVFCGLCLLARFTKRETGKLERYGILGVFAVLSAAALRASFSIPFACALALIGFIICVYAVSGWCGRNEDSYPQLWELEKNAAAIRIIGGVTLLFFTFVSIWTVFRVLTYSAPTFDFGIFSQMFYQMKTTGIPNTTLERDGLLSHFQVHVSPIYYLMLPFYGMYPKPITLQILQAAVLALAVIPLWKLARKHGCTALPTVLLCLMFLLYPALSGGASYDLHENVFLILLLLWLFYTIDCQNSWGAAVFGILTLMVKEDAAVYVAIIALWLLLNSLLNQEKHRLWGVVTGLLLFIGAVTWFLLVTGYLAKYGDGVMTYRYSNFMYEDSSSLFTVIKAAILSPMKVIYECADQEKLWFITLTMLPLCGMPLITRRYERFILLIPYVLVNLMSDYQYQHDIFFQYTYGSMACLFYLTIINYSDVAAKLKKTFLKYIPLLLAVVISGVCFTQVVIPKAIQYPMRYINQKAYYSEVNDLLQLIPADASVTATTFYTVPLSNRDVIYDVRYSSKEHLLSTEYVVLDMNNKENYVNYAESGEDGYDSFVKLLQENGYALIAEVKDKVAIYFKSGKK